MQIKIQNQDQVHSHSAYFATIILLVLLLGAAIASAIYFRSKMITLQTALATQSKQPAENETAILVAKVGKLMTLPDSETPTIATVKDAQKLKDQPFFAKAQDGFKVLIYSNAKKAILYDPSADKIVEVAAFNAGDTPTTNPEQQPQPQPQDPQP